MGGLFKAGSRLIAVAAALAVVFATLFYAAHPHQSEAREPSWMMPGDNGCSGVHIGHDLVLTANHCVAGGYDKAAFELLWGSAAYDVALLRSNEPMNRDAARLACREVVIGEPVYAMTYPGLRGAKRVLWRSEGLVGSLPLPRLMEWKHAVLMNLSASHGSSGGPIYAANGDVLGLVVGGFTPWGNMTIAVPSSVLCRLVGRF